MANNAWRTLSGSKLDNDDIYEQLRLEFTDPRWVDSTVYVGCDSQNIGRFHTSFVQVVCVHHKDQSGTGKGGRVFYIRHIERRYKSMMERLLRECELSIKLAQKIYPMCVEYGINFEVHADVNPKKSEGSNIAHDSVKGWITGFGFNVKTKPLAFAASIVADVHTRSVRYTRPKKSGRQYNLKTDDTFEI